MGASVFQGQEKRGVRQESSLGKTSRVLNRVSCSLSQTFLLSFDRVEREKWSGGESDDLLLRSRVCWKRAMEIAMEGGQPSHPVECRGASRGTLQQHEARRPSCHAVAGFRRCGSSKRVVHMGYNTHNRVLPSRVLLCSNAYSSRAASRADTSFPFSLLE
jgi:hypothetical protein